jgi:uncharacterized repeat protein (TIGR02543 family)
MKKHHRHSAGIYTLIAALIIILSLTSIFSISYAEPVHGGSSADGFEAALNNIRGEYLEALADPSGAAADLRTITIDTSDIIPAEQHDPMLTPATGKRRGVAPQMRPAKEYKVGSSDKFYVDINKSSIGKDLQGTLQIQGKHANVWVIDDISYHTAKGDSHNDATCNLKKITPAMAKDIADNFDGIYEMMTDPEAGFAPHSGVLIKTSPDDPSPKGDIDQDGRVNLVLFDIYGDGGTSSASYTSGYFWSMNFYSGENPIDMLAIDVGAGQGYNALTTGDSIATYSILAHEFQHMLFYMYYGIYLYDFNVSWFNEAMSELAATYYVKRGTEIATFGRINSAAANGYNSSSFSDFFAHSNQKNYGMEKLFAMNAYKISGGQCAHNLYNHFRSTYPPTEYTNNQKKVSALLNRTNAVGNMLKPALGAGLPSLQAMSDEDALRSVYSLFMETFAADGGLVATPAPVQTTKLYNKTYGSDNLWGCRAALGASGQDGHLHLNGSSSYYDLRSSTPLPTLESGNTVSVNGYGYSYSGTASVSCEKIYKLTTTSALSPLLNITVSDNDDTAGATRYYVALENPTPLGDIHHAGAEGADIFPLTKNAVNTVNTGGRRAWLFVSTWFRKVDGKKVTYGYATVPNAPALSSKSDTAVTLTAAAGFEYSIDGVTWQDSAIFTDLSPSTPYSFYQRLKKIGEYGTVSDSSPALNITTNAHVTTPDATTPDTATAETTTPDTGTTTPKPKAAKLYKVKFHVNKGKKLPKNLATKKVKFGAKLGKLPTPKRPKYKFLGWYTKKNKGKKYTSRTKLNKKATLNLYAHWKRKK